MKPAVLLAAALPVLLGLLVAYNRQQQPPAAGGAALLSSLPLSSLPPLFPSVGAVGLQLPPAAAEAAAAARAQLQRLLARWGIGGAARLDAAAFGPTREARVKQLADELDAGECQLQGVVDDLSDCTYAAVHSLNRRHVHPAVSALVKTAFFRYFKVNIYCDCPLWPDDSMCAMRACSVCECAEGEVPAPWLAAEKADAKACAAAKSPACDTEGCAIEMEGRVNQSLEPGVEAALIRHGAGWRGLDNPWMAAAAEQGSGEGGGSGEEEEYQYINLVANPERYTGYKGEHAHRIWGAIYSQACFSDGVSCSEERVFYRLLSGMHASISAHLSAIHLLDEAAGEWGPNLDEFRRRLGTPETRDRVMNLYFAYLFVLRAVTKAAPVLLSYDYDTGMPEEDRAARALVAQLLANPAISEACPTPFDEGRLWKGAEGAALKASLQATFRNITRVMDCVGCEKCKLWGKLQTLGIATALKILFSARDCGAPPLPLSPPSSSPAAGAAGAGGAAGAAEEDEDEEQRPPLLLERNEVIALVNLLGRFSQSLEFYHTLTAALQRQEGLAPSIKGKAAVV